MAKIQGITIELSADATGIEQALSDVNKKSNATTKELKQINEALKFDPGNTTLLSQKFEVLQDTISNTSTKLDALKKAQADLDAQAASGKNIAPEQFRALAREIEQTEGILKGFKRQLENVDVKINAQVDTSALDKMKQKLDEVSEKAQEVGGKMKDMGAEMSANLSAPIAAFGTAAVLAAGQFDNAVGQIQSALGVTVEEAERLEDVATSVWKDGFGESLEEVSNGLIRVQQNMKEINGDEIESVTKNALALAKAFESDVNEVTRGANNLMVNFGITADEAFDMMAKGAQNGLNFSNELFDNLSEYSGLFANMGYTVEEYFGILQRGSEAGVYNLDYLNDVMKEFQIRIKDGSDGVSTAMGDLSQSTQDVWDDFYYGKATVKDVAAAVIGDLQSMEDQTYAGMLGVELFGTKWEDLESSAMYAMLGVEGGLTDAKGAMDALTAAQEQTFGQRWESFTRNAAASLEPLGKVLLDLAEQWLPKIISAVESVANWFSNLSPTVQALTVVFGAVVAAIGPFLVIVGSIISALGSIIPVVTSVVGSIGGFSGVLAAITGPIGVAIAAITGLIAIGVALYKNWDTVKEKAGQLKEMVVNKFNELKTAAIEKFTQLKTEGLTRFEELKTNVVSKANELRTNAIAKFEELKTNAISKFTELKTNVINRFNELKTDAISKFEELRSNIVNKANELKTNAVAKFTELKTAITTTISSAKDSAVSTFNSLKEGIVTAATNAYSSAKAKFNELKTAIITPIESARDKVKSVVDGIKGFFSNLSLKIPDIKLPKLPKFSLEGSFSLNPPSVPKLSVSWNALGGIFNKPTILQSRAGLQGVGEAGSEAILPLNAETLAGIGKGIAAQMGGNGIPSTIVVQSVLDGRVVAEFVTPFVSNIMSNDYNSELRRGGFKR